MKEVPLSSCEKISLLVNLEAKTRSDGRGLNEVRPIEILFGKDYGNCLVVLGETRVLSQVTCEITEPRPSRPNEGRLSIAIHLSPMAAAHFEPGKGGDIVDDLQQILDRNIKDSRCVDLESLCIMAEENVWHFKVNVTVLNHAGNLSDACNLSAVAALRHFHRPDVTVGEDGRITVHTKEEKDFIPTFLKKIPVCLTYALFTSDSGCITIIDPTEKEERVMSGKLIIGLNPHGEITSLIFPGKICVEKHFIMNCVSKSYIKAKSIAEIVMKRVEEDLEESRRSGCTVNGYLNVIKSDSEYCKNNILSRAERLKSQQSLKEENKDENTIDVDETISIKAEERDPELMGNNVDPASSSSEEEFSQEALKMTLPEIRAGRKAKAKRKIKAEAKAKTNIKDNEMDTVSCKLDIKSL